MPRIDARIKTSLPAKAFQQSSSNKKEALLTIKELSLSGALIDCPNIPKDKNGIFTIKTNLPHFGKVELHSDVIRVNGQKTAVRFYYSEKNTLWALWEHIKKKLHTEGQCPYCGYGNSSKKDYCLNCGGYLDFDDDSYLDKHLKETFPARIQTRANRLNIEHFYRIIRFIDSELLKVHVKSVDKEFVGTCPAIMKVFSAINKVAPTDMNVLILGESGTGKELTAKAIHERSGRRGKPFVPFNCAAIPEGLLEAELFGYQRGAFTGAYATKKGRFEIAAGGTIFLDEIGDLSPSLQAKLLRFLEDRIVERIGASAGRKVDVRIIAATNCDLDSKLKEESFRQDLFFRLNGFTIALPPLRERGEDKVILAKYFFRQIAESNNYSLKGFSQEALDAIRRYEWPGNVRELINKVRRGIVMASGEFINACDMELATADSAPSNAFGKMVSQSKKEIVLAALKENNYVIARTARALGVSRPGLYNMMKRYGIRQ